MNLKKLFHPDSIAIVGVSHERNKIGHLVAKNIINQGYKGELYFINKKFRGKILDRPVYPSLTAVKKPIDLAVLALPAEIAVYLLDEINKLKIKNVVIFAAGFRETDKKGELLEKNLYEKARKYQINVLGPNCLGFISSKNGINATFLKNNCPEGNIGFISQSGALGSAIVDYLNAHINLGFSYFVSLGNKTIIDESDVLDYLAHDDNTKVIGMYLEDVKDGEKFKKMLLQTAMKKPVIILKSGRTREGAEVAISHTGSMIGDDEIFSSVFKEYGAIRADSYYEFISFLKVFSFSRPPKNSNVLVLSNAGGAGVLLTDELVKNKLKLVTISPKIMSKLKKSPLGGKKVSIHNPIDLLGDASAFDYYQAVKLATEEKNIGAVIVLLTPQANTQISETAKVLATIQKNLNQPIYPIFMGKKSMTEIGKFFEKEKIAGFSNFDYLPKVLAKICERKSHLEKEKINKVISKLRVKSYDLRFKNSNENLKLVKDILWKQKTKIVNLMNSLQILQLISLPVEKIKLINHINELEKIGEKVDFPLVAKVISDRITHKTDVGGVKIDIKDIDELRKDYLILSKLGTVGLQKMIKGYEVFVGGKRDAVFGPVLSVGLGGIYTELLKEIAFRVYPFSYSEFIQMIEETKLSKLLRGFRGSRPADLKKLYEIITKIGDLMMSFPEIKEIDVNPLMVHGKTMAVVDGRIIIKNSNDK